MTHAARRRWYRFIGTVGSIVFLRIRTDENVTVQPIRVFLSRTMRRAAFYLCGPRGTYRSSNMSANFNLVLKLITRAVSDVKKKKFTYSESGKNEKLNYTGRFLALFDFTRSISRVSQTRMILSLRFSLDAPLFPEGIISTWDLLFFSREARWNMTWKGDG